MSGVAIVVGGLLSFAIYAMEMSQALSLFMSVVVLCGLHATVLVSHRYTIAQEMDY